MPKNHITASTDWCALDIRNNHRSELMNNMPDGIQNGTKDSIKNSAWQYPKPFTKEIQINDDHVDRLGHTNNVKYLEWLEAIAWEHIESLGYGWDTMHKSGFALAITNTVLNYRIASYVGDSLVLGTWISFNDQRFKCGRAFQLIRVSDLKTVLTASMEFACIKLSNGRPSKMPSDMSLALNSGARNFTTGSRRVTSTMP